MDKYEYIVINDKLEEAVKQVHSIIENESCKPIYQADFITKMNNGLLQL